MGIRSAILGIKDTMNIYTDGGCSGNPGPGGWAYVMVQKTPEGESITAEEWGSEKNTTNNRMELFAVIAALKAIEKNTVNQNDYPDSQDQRITVHTDSQYVQKGITEWITAWKRNSWKTSEKKPVKNQDLWQELDKLAEKLTIQWKWIPGHAGNIYNERCDSMTQKAIAEL